MEAGHEVIYETIHGLRLETRRGHKRLIEQLGSMDDAIERMAAVIAQLEALVGASALLEELRNAGHLSVEQREKLATAAWYMTEARLSLAEVKRQ